MLISVYSNQHLLCCAFILSTYRISCKNWINDRAL